MSRSRSKIKEPLVPLKPPSLLRSKSKSRNKSKSKGGFKGTNGSFSRSRSKSKKGGSLNLFQDLEKGEKKKYKVKLGYGNEDIAHQTIKNVKKFELSIQRQLINSMLNRAKYNKNQTKGMRDAIKIYTKWMKEH